MLKVSMLDPSAAERYLFIRSQCSCVTSAGIFGERLGNGRARKNKTPSPRQEQYLHRV